MKRMMGGLMLLLMAGFALAQSNPIEYQIETYIVSQITTDSGDTQEKFSPATSARPGQVVEYRIIATNTGDTTLPAGIVVITGPIPKGTSYIEGSATPTSERVFTEFTADGATYSEPPIFTGSGESRILVAPEEYSAVRWTLQIPLEPGQQETFIYRVTVE